MAADKINPIQAIKDAVTASLKNAGPQLMGEFERHLKQGPAEIASLLFNGSAFVQYGPGQHTPEPENTNDAVHDQQHEHGGMER